MFTRGWALPASWPICQIFGFWGAKFTIICDSLPWTPMNRRAKFDAASFILGGEIRNRTNTQKQTNKQTNSKRYIHTLLIGMCG